MSTQWVCFFFFQTRTEIHCSGCWCTGMWDALVIILLFLLPPVLVELMDFHGGVSLLKQVKRLRVIRKIEREIVWDSHHAQRWTSHISTLTSHIATFHLEPGQTLLKTAIDYTTNIRLLSVATMSQWMRCLVLWKPQKKGEKQGATVALNPAPQINVGGTVTLRDKQRSVWKPFICGKYRFSSVCLVLDSFAKEYDSSRFVTVVVWWHAALALKRK